jgi:hypothetical protein
MSDLAMGQVWEIYSNRDREWIRAVVARVEDREVTLRYVGSLELLTASADDLENSPERFRPVIE